MPLPVIGSVAGPPGPESSEAGTPDMLRDESPWVLRVWRRVWRSVAAERQILLRSHGEVRHIRISRISHVVGCVVAAACITWVSYSSYAYFGLQDAVREREAEIARSEDAYRKLTREVAESRRHFLSIAGALERNHTQLVSLMGQNNSLRGDVELLRGKLENAETKRRETDEQRETLKRQLSSLEGQIREAESRNAELASTIDTTTAAAQSSGDRPQGSGAPSRIVRLESRLFDVRKSQELLLARITDATVSDIDWAEELIKRTGLAVERRIARAPASESENASGGPFIPVKGAASGPFQQGLSSLYTQMDRWETLKRLVRHLPLMSPVEQYWVASNFGRRRDPFNKRWGMHKGLDLAGPSGQKIRSPAPGKVVYAGRNGGFGRFIEIDHGYGIRTRYGHLRRILVKKGARVEHRDPIGILGTSGRSTGPHVHYEILIDGEQVNPSKFLNAGRNVFQG